MEDVRKLANKFVPTSIANQIIEFLSNISASNIDVSAENDNNHENLRQTSGERSRNQITDDSKHIVERNIKVMKQNLLNRYERGESRFRKRVTQSTMKYLPKNTGKDIRWPDYSGAHRKPNKSPYIAQSINKHQITKQSEETDDVGKDSDSNFHDKYREKVDISFKERLPSESNANNNRYRMKTERVVNIFNSKDRYNDLNKYRNHKVLPKDDDAYDSTIGYTEPVPDGIYSPKQYRFAKVRSDEVNQTVEDDSNGTHGNVINMHAQKYKPYVKRTDLTTAKEKNEFDQYDSNYPRNDYVATSGLVALPKVKKDGYLDNNQVGRSKEVKRKVWF